MQGAAAVDWNGFIDAYCERTGPDFWSEPLNAATDLAFWVAAYAVARRLRSDPGAAFGGAAWSLRVLVGLLVAIGAGSFMFHTFATRWAELADVVPIQLFILWWCVCFGRWGAGLRWRWSWLGAPAFLLLARALAEVVPTAAWFGSAGYLPAWIGLVLCGGWLLLRQDARWCWLAAAAGMFAVSLTLSTIDQPLCSRWPIGTHFLWHIANAVTQCLAACGVLPVLPAARAPRPQEPSPAAAS